MSTELLNNIAGRVGTLEKDVGDIKVSIGKIETKLEHVPTKAQLLGWGAVGLLAVVVVLWRIVATLLESQGAKLAAELAKAIHGG